MQASDAAVDPDRSIHGEHSVPFFSPESRYVPREVRPATSAWERPLMVQLSFRGQLNPVIVPASMHMSVDKLLQIAASLVGSVAASLRLMSGDTLLRLGTSLEDYPGHIGHLGMHVTVLSAVSTPPARSPPRPADMGAAGHTVSNVVAPSPGPGTV
jgi:hypothetical protein